MNVQQRFSAQASGLQCTSYRSTNACVAVNCIRCGRLTMVAGSATLVQGCERSFSGQGPGLSSKCSAEVLDGQLVSAVLGSSVGKCCALACMSCRLITDATLQATASRAYGSAILLVDCACKEFCLLHLVPHFDSGVQAGRPVHSVEMYFESSYATSYN